MIMFIRKDLLPFEVKSWNTMSISDADWDCVDMKWRVNISTSVSGDTHNIDNSGTNWLDSFMRQINNVSASGCLWLVSPQFGTLDLRTDPYAMTYALLAFSSIVLQLSAKYWVKYLLLAGCESSSFREMSLIMELSVSQSHYHIWY